MNLRTLLPAVAAAFVLIACGQEEILPIPETPDTPAAPSAPATRTIRVSASSETHDTKTSLDGTILRWDSGDSFRILSDNGVDWKMTLTGEAGGSTGTFEGQTTSEVEPDQSAMAVFPWNAFSSYSSGAMTVSVPQVQQYTSDSFDPQANIMAGRVSSTADGYSASFKNLMGVLKLTLTGEDEYLSSIEVTDKAGKSLWGKATVPAQSFQEGLSVDMLSEGSSTIRLECHGAQLSSTPTIFYISVPAGAFQSGFDLKMTTLDERQASVSAKSANLISRSKIKAMPKLAVKDFEIGEFDITNDALKAYMGKSGDPEFQHWEKGWLNLGESLKGGATLLDNSILNNAAYKDQDRPLYKTVQWQGDASASYQLTFKDETSGRVVFADREVTGTSYELQNMVPGRTYSYVVRSADSIVMAGKFKVTGQVRMVTIEDSWNYRDLGGWTSTLGGSVRYELIYRGSSLNGKWQKDLKEYARNQAATPSDYVFGDISRQQIKDMGIKAELDLRATIGQESKPTERKYVHENALGQNNTGISDWIYFQNSSGGAQTNPTSDNAVVTDVRWIIEQVLNDIPVAFHCKSGADRTGCVAMTILSLLGVSQGDVCRDYELTTFSREYTVLQGKTDFRTKKANDVSSDYKFFHKGFTTLTPGGKSDATQQEKAYYYLNQTFASASSPASIPAATLDAFISKMLGIPYTHPAEWTWAN